jgi:unsaturated chondroitin disaccharide hydrolase
MKHLYAAALFGLLILIPNDLLSQPSLEKKNPFLFFDEVMEHAQIKLSATLEELSFDPTMHPSHTNPETGRWETSYMRRNEWTSGFFAGSLWYMYTLTGDENWKEYAFAWTDDLESEANHTNDHDTGFRIMNSFGNGYKISGNRPYFQVLARGARTLTSRFNPNIGAIKSWDWIGNYPVIIDNLMNLELLFFISQQLENQHLYDIALRHAETTLRNHLRADGSTYHIVDFDNGGNVNWKDTRQGYGPNSVWARGQAWAIYGFTMTYRFTGDKKFLDAARAAADYFIEHLPDDFVPAYDFMEPYGNVRTKDVSASSITASALFELYSFTNREHYFNTAVNILNALYSEEFMTLHSTKSSILRQTTLHRGFGNVGTSYADYYLLEAIIRYRELTAKPFPLLSRITSFYLEQNYPNPFNDSTHIYYSIEETSEVEITLFDIMGRKIRTLVRESHTPGTYNIYFGATGLSTGTYFYSLTAGNQRQIRKMTLIK